MGKHWTWYFHVFSWTQAATISWWFRWYLRTTTDAHNQVILFLIEGRYFPSRKLAFFHRCDEHLCRSKHEKSMSRSFLFAEDAGGSLKKPPIFATVLQKEKIKEALKLLQGECHQTLQVQLLMVDIVCIKSYLRNLWKKPPVAQRVVAALLMGDALNVLSRLVSLYLPKPLKGIQPTTLSTKHPGNLNYPPIQNHLDHN